MGLTESTLRHVHKMASRSRGDVAGLPPLTTRVNHTEPVEVPPVWQACISIRTRRNNDSTHCESLGETREPVDILQHRIGDRPHAVSTGSKHLVEVTGDGGQFGVAPLDRLQRSDHEIGYFVFQYGRILCRRSGPRLMRDPVGSVPGTGSAGSARQGKRARNAVSRPESVTALMMVCRTRSGGSSRPTECPLLVSPTLLLILAPGSSRPMMRARGAGPAPQAGRRPRRKDC